MLKLDEGERKYWVGLSLNTAFVFLTGPPARALAGPVFDWGAWATVGLPDAWYNWEGITGGIKDEEVSGTIAVDSETNFYRKYNSVLRLPALATGVGMVGKYCVDLFNQVVNGAPMNIDSHHYLEYGLGLISVSSSMHIKETDPKLLGKESFWEKVYNWIKEKTSSLAPKPITQPFPVQSNYRVRL